MSQQTLLPASIQGRLSGARLRLRTVDYALGVARAILAAALALVVLFALDTMLEPPLFVIRAFALFVGVVAAAAATVFLARPARRRLSDDDVALLVESEYPELNDSLVSSVQLARDFEGADVHVSRDLIRSTIERTERDVERLEFGRVVRTGPLVPLWVLILAFLAGGGLMATNDPTSQYVDIFQRRVFLGQEGLSYPKLVALQVGRRTIDGLAFAPGEGVIVASVAPHSAAEEAGFAVGDAVVALDGEPVADLGRLGALLQRYQLEDDVDVAVKRGAEQVELAGVVGTDVVDAVAKGDDLTIDVFVTKGADRVDSGLVVHTRYEGIEGEETRELLLVGEGHFTKAYQNVTKPFEFYVEDPRSGVTTRAHRVEVVQRPRVERYEFVLDYPDYTGKSTERVTQPDLQVATGTEITYLVVSNKTLDRARLVFELEKVTESASGRRRRTTVEEPGPEPLYLDRLSASALEPGGEWEALAPVVEERELTDEAFAGRVLVGRFGVDRDLRFRYELLSEEGYATGKKPVVFAVRAVVDRRPQVGIPVPGRRKQVTPQAKVPLRIEAEDDYGIKDLVLRLRPEAPGEASPQAIEEVELTGFEIGATEVELEHTIDVADQRLQPGERLHYFAVAFDHNEDESRNFKESRPYELLVVRPEDLERILQDRLSALKEQLEAAARDQEEAKEQAEGFVAELGPKDIFTDDDKRRLQRIGYEQRRVTNRLVEIRQELVDIRTERELNRLDDQSAMMLLEDLLAGVEDLAERASPHIQQELHDSRVAPRVDERTRTRLARVPDLQHDVIQALAALAARIDKWGDFTEVIQDWRDLGREQDTIIERTKEAAREEHR